MDNSWEEQATAGQQQAAARAVWSLGKLMQHTSDAAGNTTSGRRLYRRAIEAITGMLHSAPSTAAAREAGTALASVAARDRLLFHLVPFVPRLAASLRLQQDSTCAQAVAAAVGRALAVAPGLIKTVTAAYGSAEGVVQSLIQQLRLDSSATAAAAAASGLSRLLAAQAQELYMLLLRQPQQGHSTTLLQDIACALAARLGQGQGGDYAAAVAAAHALQDMLSHASKEALASVAAAPGVLTNLGNCLVGSSPLQCQHVARSVLLRLAADYALNPAVGTAAACIAKEAAELRHLAASPWCSLTVVQLAALGAAVAQQPRPAAATQQQQPPAEQKKQKPLEPHQQTSWQVAAQPFDAQQLQDLCTRYLKCSFEGQTHSVDMTFAAASRTPLARLLQKLQNKAQAQQAAAAAGTALAAAAAAGTAAAAVRPTPAAEQLLRALRLKEHWDIVCPTQPGRSLTAGKE